MRVLLSKPDSLGDQLIAAGVVQALGRLRPDWQIVWHVRKGMEACASLLGASVFHPCRELPPLEEAARLRAVKSPLLLLPYPLHPFETWSGELRDRAAWWTNFLRAQPWDATVLALVNRTWVGDLTSTAAPAPVRVGFAAAAGRQPFVNEIRELAGRDEPGFTTALKPSFDCPEATQLRDLFAVIEPRLREIEPAPVWQPPTVWQRTPTGLDGARIAIAPGVGGDPRRSWSRENFARLADALRTRGATVSWLEGPGDGRYLPPVTTAERFSSGADGLTALMARLEDSDLLICHDTAYVHLAAGFGIPTVALYGAGQRTRFHPIGGRIKIVQTRIACAGCQWHCLWDRLHCVADIPPDAVIAAAEAMLAGNATPVAVSLPTPVSAAPEGEATAVMKRLQAEILNLNADRFARLQIIQRLTAQPDAGINPSSSAGSKLSVIIPMGRPERAALTLASLSGQRPRPESWEVILVGCEAAAVASKHAQLPIVPVTLAANELPPRTRCRGVERATGDWFLFLDDDVELAADCGAQFATLLSTYAYATEAEPPVGAIGFRLPGKSGRFFERLTDISNFWAQQQELPDDRDWLYSAALLVRADAYHKAGGFNPELPNGEDVDLTRRIAAAGYRLRYEPGLVARHDHRRDTLTAMWRYFWRNGNAARHFFSGHGGACPFSIKTAWLKAWSDLCLNREFQHRHGAALGLRAPLIWLNYLIVESSLEWHWQAHLHEERRYRRLPARARSDATYVKALTAWDAGRTWAAGLRYALAVLQDFANPVRR